MKSDQLNKITEQLGEDHDMFVFLETFRKLEGKAEQEELQMLVKQVEHQRELNMIKLHPRLKQFFSETPGMFEEKMKKIFKPD